MSPTKSSNNNAEGWSLMPDGTVLTVQVNGAPAAEKYVPCTDLWVSAASTPNTLPLVSLKDPVRENQITSKEIGRGLTLPDGRCFFVGGTGRTALYTQGAAPGQPGSWAAAPNLPADTTANKYNQVNGNLHTAIDAPALPGLRMRSGLSGGPAFLRGPLHGHNHSAPNGPRRR